jgi:hypothetical protein
MFTLATISTSYWDLAEEFAKQAIAQFNTTSRHAYSVYVFPAILFYCSAVEALINENLALLEGQKIEDAKRQRISEVKKGVGEFRDAISKLREACNLLSRTGTDRIEDDVLQNYQALVELRNAIVHYCPDYIDILNWPLRLRQALQRSGVEPTVGDWTITFRSQVVLNWAQDTAKQTIERFLLIMRKEHNHFFGH